MSKQRKVAVEEQRREEQDLRRINRIPEVEALFLERDNKNGKKRSFLSKLAKKDWKQATTMPYSKNLLKTITAKSMLE